MALEFNVSFNVEIGKITGIVGSSNSGKSDLIDLMSGFSLESDEGIFFDDDINFNDIGVMYQDIESQFFSNNIGREFYSILKIKGIKDINKKITSSLKMFGLDESYLYRSPFELSLSEQKCISLALVLSFNPKIILLDEPTFGLDNKEKERFIKLIRMMKLRYGKTIVIASRDTEMIYKLADNVVLLNKGSVVKIGDKYNVLADEKLLSKCGLLVPNVVRFSNIVHRRKKIKIGYRDDINDLVKDIYRFVR